jgi:hypothetical protein
MRRERMQNRSLRLARSKRPPFAFDDATREGLALIFRRHRHPKLKKPGPIRELISALEIRAGQFIETRQLSVQNSDLAVREAIRKIFCATTDLREALDQKKLPPRARTELLVRLDELNERYDVLGQVRAGTKLLRYAAARALADLAPNAKGGRPVDHRGQRFGADIALILSDVGMLPRDSVEGPVAEVLEIVFDAVGHEPGDMRTLLKGVLRHMEK